MECILAVSAGRNHDWYCALPRRRCTVGTGCDNCFDSAQRQTNVIVLLAGQEIANACQKVVTDQ